MAQSSNILSSYTAHRYYLALTFKDSIQVSTLHKDIFTLETNEATPQKIPFKDINVSDDYNSIKRTLILYFQELPPYAGDYSLTIDGIRTASGYDYETETLTITYDYDNTSFEVPDSPDDFVEVEDKSIREDVFDPQSTIFVADPDFYVSGTNPDNGEVFIESDYNNGVVKIEFSAMPDPSYATVDHIKVQRKQFALGLSRWERITAEFEADPVDPVFYVKFPSLDATPVYDTVGTDYFEDGYKYRIRLSAEIEPEEQATPSTSDSLGAPQEIVFATNATPLYVDPSEFVDYYPELTLVEALELVHLRSLEVYRIFDGDDSDLPFIAYEYIRAAVHCALGRRYEFAFAGGAETLTLGDLTVNTQSYPKKQINRANAGTPCELAEALRQELIRIGGAGMRSVVTGTNYPNPMPKRKLRDFEKPRLRDKERWN